MKVKKLTVRKETIAHLDDAAMDIIKGGDPFTWDCRVSMLIPCQSVQIPCDS